jgi:hypothetical protein
MIGTFKDIRPKDAEQSGTASGFDSHVNFGEKSGLLCPFGAGTAMRKVENTRAAEPGLQYQPPLLSKRHSHEVL